MGLEDVFPESLPENSQREKMGTAVWLWLWWPLHCPRPLSSDLAGSITVCISGASLLELH